MKRRRSEPVTFTYEYEIKVKLWANFIRFLRGFILLDKNSLIQCIAHTTYIYDPDYGADADGRRGMGMWFLDDVIVDSWIIDGFEVYEKEVPKEVVKSIDRQIADYDDWKEAESEEPDQDWRKDR